MKWRRKKNRWSASKLFDVLSETAATKLNFLSECFTTFILSFSASVAGNQTNLNWHNCCRGKIHEKFSWKQEKLSDNTEVVEELFIFSCDVRCKGNLLLTFVMFQLLSGFCAIAPINFLFVLFSLQVCYSSFENKIF